MARSMMQSKTTRFVAVVIVGGVLIACGLLAGLGPAQGPATSDRSTEDAAAVRQAKGLSRAFRSAAKQVLPTVVMVRTMTEPDKPSRTPERTPPENPFRGTPFEDFFGDRPFGPGFHGRGIPREPSPGLGSGVIIDASGIVLTNNHVIEDADKVVVQLGDGREFTATDIKTDKRTDLAVLRIKADGPLPAAKLGDSDELEIGDWVIAIGNPFALDQTVSAGIISGKGRSLGAVRRARFLQTDAAINPGNSGGPLVNLEGEVVGINTAIFSRTGGYQGIGFAVPANVARWVTPQLVEKGIVTRAYLGVSIGQLTAEAAAKLDIPLGTGVVVGQVGKESPAGKAGILVDDVILTFDGEAIRTTADLQERVERSKAGSSHEIRLIREGKPSTVQVVVEAMPESFETSMNRSPQGRLGTSKFYHDRELGLVVIDMTDALAKQLGYEELSGVLVMNVDKGRLAASAGLREGALIVRVGAKEIGNVAEYEEAMKDQSLSKGITLDIQTDRGKQTLTLQSS